MLVNQMRQQFFTRSTLAFDENSDIAGGNLQSEINNRAYSFAPCDNFSRSPSALKLLLQIGKLALHHVMLEHFFRE